jgi:hypothetical protein
MGSPDTDEEDDRPWQKPGAVRRDCEPHRGEFLLTLGKISWALAWASLCTVISGLIADLLGVVVLLQVRHDLKRMKAGQMDPAGQSDARRARDYALRGMLVSLIWPIALYVTLIVFYLAR